MMKIGANSKIANYNMDVTANSSTKKKDLKKAGSTADCLELSADGIKALKNSKSEEKSYDLAKVLAIHEKGFHEIPSREESDYYWEARRNDPALDARLYAEDKAEAIKFVGQVQTILMKARSGQKLTPEEKALVQNDPFLKQEIELRKSQAL
ncbi:hypothetical protein lbkm_2187 [Lachnospiraceae bacterium KM106-2]|nr:hypothetical protein lbkm_2187 [Lachnospiraceae bacterium KM106-2]